MRQTLALFVTSAIIFWQWWVDREVSQKVSGAILIPYAWLFLASSRYVSGWMDIGRPIVTVDSYIDGSPVDRFVFLALVLAGAIVLLRRRIGLGRLCRDNAWCCLFFVFSALSVLWSDYPIASFKRWTKLLGNLIMVLIISTEARPSVATEWIMRRLSLVLVPLSVLFVRYYPELGRSYHMGNPTYTGVSHHKNGLGSLCLVCGIYFLWRVLVNSRYGRPVVPMSWSVYVLTCPMIGWLLYMANSATSTMCTLIAVAILVIARRPFVVRKPRRLAYILLGCIVAYVVLNASLDIKNRVIGMLGRKADLTTRVPMWEELLTMSRRPIVGYGYESFFSGERMTQIWEKHPGIVQAHNGYLDIYLNTGIVGLGLLVLAIWSGLRRAVANLGRDYAHRILLITYAVVILLYDWTEAAFKPMSALFVVLLLAIVEVHGEPRAGVQSEHSDSVEA